MRTPIGAGARRKLIFKRFPQDYPIDKKLSPKGRELFNAILGNSWIPFIFHIHHNLLYHQNIHKKNASCNFWPSFFYYFLLFILMNSTNFVEKYLWINYTFFYDYDTFYTFSHHYYTIITSLITFISMFLRVF